MKHPEPLITALLKCYCKHRRFFYLENFQSFKLFASWYLGTPTGTEYVGVQLPWYRSTYEVQQLAKILTCTEQEVLGIIEEYYDEH